MPSRLTWLYALLVLLPTLLVAGVLLRLLTHERERLARAGVQAAEEQTRAVAEQIGAAMQGFEDDLLRRLAGLPATNLAAALKEWESRDPLVRRAFVVSDTRGVLLPDPRGAQSSEDADFLHRFAPLFSGEISWSPTASAETLQRPLLTQNLRVQAAQQAADAQAAPAAAPRIAPDGPGQGCLPWFAGRDLHLLAWVRRPGLRYGVEVEMAALLARIVPSFPAAMPAGRALALLDGHGRVAHAVGDLEIGPAARPVAAAPLAPALPHWQVAAYGGTGAGRAFLFRAGAALTALLVLVLLGGGWFLWRDARRSQVEARTRTSFVANVSHELKTPLTSIRMYAELLGEERVRDEARRRHYLDVIVRESQRLTRLVNNVLDFSRLDRGRKTYRPEKLDLAAEARRIVDTQRDRLAEAGLAVELDAPADVPCTARADRDAFEQALLNLLDNAVKYAAGGKRLAVAVTRAAGRPAVRVTDFGPGVPAGQRRRLFAAFHRADDALTARQPGCGLGLHLSRRLLRDQGGDLLYDPAPEGGARFTIVLPPGEDVT
jgi:signal transduction histidine kinase